MKNDPDDRLIQTFLGGSGVYEVYKNYRTDVFWCTCPGNRLKFRTCKHLTYINDRMVDGTYKVAVTKDFELPDLDFLALAKDQAGWTAMIRQHVVPQVA